MKDVHRKVIHDHLAELVDSLESSVAGFFAHLRSRNVINLSQLTMADSKTVPKEKLNTMFSDLINIDDTWDHIIEYLITSGREELANKLKTAAREQPVTAESCRHLNIARRPIEKNKFMELLADFYICNYSKVKLVDTEREMKDLWVPIDMEKYISHPLSSPSAPPSPTGLIGYMKMLDDLQKSNKLILIEGGPGAGKTTLLKRIAHDWAKQHQQSTSTSWKILNILKPPQKIIPVELVLSVPVRKLGNHEDLLLSIAEYFIEQLNRKDMIKANDLATIFTQLDSNLLICLDGLDQSSDSVNFLQNLFGTTSNAYIAPKLIATTRYCPAYHTISAKYFKSYRLKISDLSASNRDEFRKNYGRFGRKRIIDSDHNNNPLVLSVACHLAARRGKVTKTLLFDEWQKELLMRKCDDKRSTADREEDPMWLKWRQSKQITATAKLAFEGCQKRSYQFTASEIDSDTLACGFLVHHGVKEGINTAKFQHESAQQYFASLYCFQQVESHDVKVLKSVIEQIFFGTNEIGRFFFGLCSKEKKIGKILDSTNPSWSDLIVSILSPMGFGFNYKSFLSECFADCTKKERKKIERLLVPSNSIQKSTRNRLKIHRDLLALKDYPNGHVQLHKIDDGSIPEKIVCVSSLIPPEPESSYQEINSVMWRFGYMLSGEYVNQILLQIDKFPNLQNLYLTEVDGNCEVLIRICHLCNCTTCAIQLTSFNFRFSKIQANELRKIDSQAKWLTQVSEKTGKIDNIDIIWSMVNFNHDDEIMSLKDLVASLIKFALDLLK